MTELVDVLVPANEEGTRATVLRWCKRVGDTVVKDEPLVELETDKVTVEIPAPAAGTLSEILKQVDAEVVPDEVLARLTAAGESLAPKHDASATLRHDASATLNHPAPLAAAENSRQLPPIADLGDGADKPLSPAVRRLLQEHSIAAAAIVGTGRDGRITAQDVIRQVADAPARASQVATSAANAPASPSAHASASGRVSESERPSAYEHVAAETRTPRLGGTRIPHTAIRRRVAEHMTRSLLEAPHVTTLFEADLTRVLAHRTRHAADYQARGARLTLTAYIVSACAHALRAIPEVNATFHEDALELHADANIGVGTALGNKGLIVPVIHRAQTLDLFSIALRLGQVVEAARTGKLAPEEVRGGTFTISNHGVGGSLLAAPIVINQPQVAILGVGKVERRVCVVQSDGAEAIGVRSLCYLTLTIDHRALDAFQANAFLSAAVAALENWSVEIP
jgi:2-oxoglutarate dehydrogenase E2 component (dihydrolipoamide succinyltransferase)